jgi:hypothetical protein
LEIQQSLGGYDKWVTAEYPKINKIAKPIHSSIALVIIMFIFIIFNMWGLIFYLLKKKKIASDFHWISSVLIILSSIWCICQYLADSISIKEACAVADNIISSNSVIGSLVDYYRAPAYVTSYLINILNNPYHNIYSSFDQIGTYPVWPNIAAWNTTFKTSIDPTLAIMLQPYNNLNSTKLSQNVTACIADPINETVDSQSGLSILNGFTDNTTNSFVDQWVYSLTDCKAGYSQSENVLQPVKNPPTPSCFKIGICKATDLDARYGNFAQISAMKTSYTNLANYLTNTIALYSTFNQLLISYMNLSNQIPLYVGKAIAPPIAASQELINSSFANISNSSQYNMTIVYNFTMYAKAMLCETSYSMAACAAMLSIIILFLAIYTLVIGFCGRLIRDEKITTFTSADDGLLNENK